MVDVNNECGEQGERELGFSLICYAHEVKAKRLLRVLLIPAGGLSICKEGGEWETIAVMVCNIPITVT